MARGVPSTRISTPGAEGGDNRCPKAVHNRGEDSSPPFCTAFCGGEPSIVVPTGDGHPGRRVASRLFATQRGGLPRSPSAKRPKRRRRLSSAVSNRGLGGRSRPSPSLPAMDTRGGGCHLPFSHRSTGRFADPGAPSVRNDGGYRPPPFRTVFWVAARVHRRPYRRWTPGEACRPPRLFAVQHGQIPRSPSPKPLKRRKRLFSSALDRRLGG